MNHHMFLLLRNIYIRLQTVGRWFSLSSRAFQKKAACFALPYRLHIACGKQHFQNWINIDANPFSAADIRWDISRGIPLPDASCSLIYAEHFLEHLTVEQGLKFLRDCRRLLAPEGVLRIAMPSLDLILEKSGNGTWKDQAWLHEPEYRFIQTRAEMLNMVFRCWDHQWLYDQEELSRRLKEAGFSVAYPVEWGKSSYCELAGRETRPDSLLIFEAKR